jgi:CHAD domain-containing protein/uncharacterized protein YjbK
MAVEVELKYEVPSGFRVPDVRTPDGVSMGDAVQHQLTATYWDTDDLRLARNKVTLRRRTGGTDAGWHVKRPHGADRDELQLPLGRGASSVPPKVAAEVRAISRGARLAPVVRLTTTRTEWQLTDGSGRVLAVVADDQVSAQTMGDEAILQTWREVEVELVDGDRRVLKEFDKALRRLGAARSQAPSKLARALNGRLPEPPPAGAPDTAPPGSAADVIGQYVRAQRDALIEMDPAVRRDVPDAVHKMRVATRRLRSTLRTFRPLWDRERADALRAELKWLAEELSGARDTEVMAARLAAAVQAAPPELMIGPIAARLTAGVRADTEAHRQSMIAALDSERYGRLLDDLDALIAAAPTDHGRKPAAKLVPRLVGKAVRRVDGYIAAAATAPDVVTGVPVPGYVDRDTALHEARKAAKRARYAAEAAVPVGGKRATDLAKAMEDVQEVLGDHHDSVVTRELLHGAGMAAHGAGENAFSYGILHAQQSAAAEQLEAALPTVWQDATRGKVRSWLG